MNTSVRENRDNERGQSEQFITPSASVVEAEDGYTLWLRYDKIVDPVGCTPDSAQCVLSESRFVEVCGQILQHEAQS